MCYISDIEMYYGRYLLNKLEIGKKFVKIVLKVCSTFMMRLFYYYKHFLPLCFFGKKGR